MNFQGIAASRFFQDSYLFKQAKKTLLKNVKPQAQNS